MSWIAARRYAKALMDIGVERNAYQQYAAELAKIQAMIDQVPIFKMTLLNRAFSSRAKRDVFEKVCAGEEFSTIVMHFISLLIERDRVPQLPHIIRHLREMIDEYEGRMRVTVYSVYPLEDTEAAALQGALEGALNKSSVLDHHIDRTLIGGIVLKVNNLLIDASVRSRLRGLGELLRKE